MQRVAVTAGAEAAPRFQDLVRPVSSETFFSAYWERQPLHVTRNRDGFYDALLCERDVENAISSGGLRFPAIQLARGGNFFAPEAFTSNLRSGQDIFTGVPDLKRVQAEFNAGATISLPGFHRAWKPLGALVEVIERELDHAVHTNVYLTPARAKGFRPHYDTHNVFVLQISGTKKWNIAEAPIKLPHHSQTFHSHKPTTPVLDVTLKPGDLLYVPRGMVHSARTEDTASLHVTLGVTVYTMIEVFAELLQGSKYDLRFRQALPPGFATRAEVKQKLKEKLSELLIALQNETVHERTIDSFAQNVLADKRMGTFHIGDPSLS